MNCKESRRRISLMIWDRVPLPGELAEHINECEACSGYYSNYLRGINGILKTRNNVPDLDIWKKIEHRASNEPTPGNIIKLALSITSAAAAVITGIIAANLVVEHSDVIEKEQYKQEISLQSSNLSGIDENFIEYYNYENPEK